MLHRAPDQNAFDDKRQIAELEYLVSLARRDDEPGRELRGRAVQHPSLVGQGL